MKKLENNWRKKTLENLEKDFWGEPAYDSYLVRRTHEIRKLPLIELAHDDIAMMLRQQFSLDYLVPLAIDKLEIDILAYGERGHEGAIMDALVNIPADYWATNKENWNIIRKLLDDNITVWTFKRENFDEANPN